MAQENSTLSPPFSSLYLPRMVRAQEAQINNLFVFFVLWGTGTSTTYPWRQDHTTGQFGSHMCWPMWKATNYKLSGQNQSIFHHMYHVPRDARTQKAAQNFFFFFLMFDTYSLINLRCSQHSKRADIGLVCSSDFWSLGEHVVNCLPLPLNTQESTKCVKSVYRNQRGWIPLSMFDAAKADMNPELLSNDHFWFALPNCVVFLCCSVTWQPT